MAGEYTLYECQQMLDEIKAALKFDEFYYSSADRPIGSAAKPFSSNYGNGVVERTRNGTVVGIDFNASASPPAPSNPVNSNSVGGSYGSGNARTFRMNTTTTRSGNTITLSSGARRVGTGTAVRTAASKLNVAATAVAAGCFLGAKIDSALYNAGNFFDLNPPEELNPETWDSLAQSEAGKSVIRHLFDLDSGSGTMYMPEDMIEYMYNYWRELGFWNTAGEHVNVNPDSISTLYHRNSYPNTLQIASTSIASVTTPTGVQFTDTYEFTSGSGHMVNTNEGGNYYTTIVSTSPFTVKQTSVTRYTDGRTVTDTYNLSSSYKSKSGTKYYYIHRGGYDISTVTAVNPGLNTVTGNPPATELSWDIAQLVYTGTIVQNPTIDGATADPNSQQLDPSQIDPSQPILPQLKQQLPNAFSNPIQETLPQDDGTSKTIVYYPVPYPTGSTSNTPTTGSNTQTNPEVEDQTSPETQIKDLIDLITGIISPSPDIPQTPTTPTAPDTGSGSTPTVIAPTGGASSLWAVYNPTQAQLDAFGSWLWSSNFVEQIKKLFNDPMQAIVGVHKVFATPSTGSQVNIKCGYIDSGCPAASVTSQYTTVDCGTVNVREYFGNVLDYAPYTEISLYLPFIGIVKMDVADVMRGSVSVKYHVDVITGACLADVKINRDGESAVLYQYSGSAIVTYPISSGSYASMAAGVLSLAAGVAGTIMTGGAAAPALIGGAVGLSHLHTEVQKSGGFSGAPGAMGGKKPYLIISRAQEALPTNFEQYEGKPASKAVTLGNCDGFVRVQSINIDGVPATYGELDQIVALLKQGVII